MSCNKHFLKCLPLMRSMEGLANAVVGEVHLKAIDETWVHSLGEFSAQTDGVMLFLGEGLGCAHQLLIINLNRDRNLIAITIKMDLMNVVQCHVLLDAIIGTELKE